MMMFSLPKPTNISGQSYGHLSNWTFCGSLNDVCAYVHACLCAYVRTASNVSGGPRLTFPKFERNRQSILYCDSLTRDGICDVT